MPCWKCIPFDLAGNNSNYQLCRQLKILKASIPPPFRVSSRPGGVRPGTPLPAQKVGTQVMPLGLSLSLLCARLPAQLGDPQQGAASGALWPLSGAAEHTGVRRGRRGQGLDGAAVGVLRPAAPKAKDPGAGGWRRRAEAAARGWMQDLPSRLPGLELRRRWPYAPPADGSGSSKSARRPSPEPDAGDSREHSN